MPMVSLRTVYQALNDLVGLGEVQAVDVGYGAVRFDPNTADHDHFVCRSCERVSDIRASRPRLMSGYPGLDRTTATGGGRAAAGYAVETAEIIFRGLCPSCGGRPVASARTNHRSRTHESATRNASHKGTKTKETMKEAARSGPSGNSKRGRTAGPSPK